MTQCTECRILESKPLNSEVPKHLRSFTVRDKLFGLKHITGYECRKCGALWRRHAAESWAFIAAPKVRTASRPHAPLPFMVSME